jgi:hypothetical protein
MSSIARLSELGRHGAESERAQVARAEALGGAYQLGEGTVHHPDGPEHDGHADQERHAEEEPQHLPALLRLAAQVGGAGHRARSLRQRECAHVPKQRVGGRAGQLGVAVGLVRTVEVGHGMGHGVRDLDLRLVLGDLVDDVVVGRGERAEAAIAPLERIGRVALFQHLQANLTAGAQQVLLGGADLGGHRGGEPAAQLGALHQHPELPRHRLIERTDRVHTQQGDHEDQADEQGHAADDAAPKAAQHGQRACATAVARGATSMVPSRTIPI